jgi:hypothetical protein
LTSEPRKDKIADVADESPLQMLRHALVAVREAENNLRAAADVAREAGHTWSEIGDVLGSTRQAAFQRFGRPIDPRTGVPMRAALLAGAAEAAVALFINLAEGNWDDARRDFDANVAEAVPDVAATWATIIGRYGRYEQRMGEPLTYQLGDLTVVDVPLQFEVGQQKGRIAFSPDGKVAGLYVLPPEVA